ncbi:MAG TPA: DUF4259 domain-containing protein [Actinomycetes bacterium]|nr:DUF4259 domain-containing protein [Actinomycetes bacterium]
MSTSTDMGAWGTGPFDNDDALDLFLEIEDAGPAEAAQRLRAALQVVAAEDDSYLEAPAANEAVAAAAVVAFSYSHSDPTGNPRVARWLTERAPALGPDDGALAAKALERVCGEHSEWLELWSEAGLGQQARAVAEQLALALQSPRP